MEQNNSKVMDEQQVYYVEPNYNVKMAEKFGPNAVDYMLDSEDYCVSIDLEIEVYARQSDDKITSGNKTFIFSYKTYNGGESTASFMGGKKINYGKDNKSFNILTTDYVNTFYTDIVNDNTNKMSSNAECFGIESINISYQTYAVPVVDITFTDIKGVSLFAPEELRHGKSNSNGVAGFPDDDIAGSFFKCFFTFPYPKFTLKVKGFYGQPVSYDLTCSKFNAKFDSKTGNFGATATLVGYAFSLFNDVSLDAVLAAPLSEYYGKEYWQNHILGRTVRHDEDGKIISTDEELSAQNIVTPEEYMIYDRYGNKVSPQTFQEIVKNIESASDKISATTATKEVFERQNNCNEIKTILENLKNEYDNIAKETVNDLIQKLGKDYVFYNDNFAEVVVLIESNEKEIKDYTQFNFTSLNDKIENYKGDNSKGSYFSQIVEIENLKYLTEELLIEEKKDTDDEDVNVDESLPLVVNDCSELTNTIKHKINTKVQTDTNLYRNHKKAIYFNNRQFFISVDTSLQNVNDVNKETTEEIDKVNNEIISDILGFSPSVENFVKVILCHLETFLYIIHKTTNDANDMNRSVKDFKIADVKTSGLDVDHIMPAWPKVTEQDENNELHDAWIGNFYTNGKAQPEANAVEGLIKAVQNFSKTCETVAEVVTHQTSENTSNTTTTDLTLPLMLSDIIISGNPFGTDTMVVKTDSQLNEIVSRLFMRMINTATLIDDDKKYDYGKFDAINFYNIYGNQFTKHTQDALRSIDESKIIDIMTNVDGDGNLWTDKQKLMSKTNNENYLTHHLVRFPLHDITLMDEKSDINNYTLSPNGKKEKNSNYVNDLFFIDKTNFNKYSNIISNNTNCSDEDATKYQKYIANGLLKQLKYNKNKIYNSDQCFTNDYDGWSSEYIDDGITLSYFLKNSNNEKSQNETFEYIKYDKRNNFELNNAAYHRDELTFAKICQNEKIGTDNIVDDFTFPSLRCHDGSDDYSLVLNPAFYSAKTIDEKAVMFLECFRHHDMKHFMKMVLSQVKTDDSYLNEVIYTTKVCALLLGGYLKLTQNRSELFDGKNRMDNSDDIDEYDNICKKIDRHIQNRFIEYFDKWINDEFKKIYDDLYISTVNSDSVKTETIHAFHKALKKKEINHGNLGKYFKDVNKFLSLYKRYDEKGNLYFNEENVLIKQLTKLYCEPLLIIKPHFFTNIFENEVEPKIKKANSCQSYIKGFADKIKELLNKNVPQAQTEDTATVNQVTPQRVPEEIKIGLYNYLKVIHDKWMYTNAFEKWTVAVLYKHFHFIDAYYNKIGHLAYINPLKMVELINQSKQQENTTLLSFMSSVFQDNNMNIQCVQNFIDLETDKDYLNRMQQMFTPVPYIEQNDCDDQPHFVCIYIGQTSSHLDIEGSQYTNDSFDLSDTKNWPVAISSKTPKSGYKIPAFGVSFGSQYQSFFTDINITSDSPTVTEQSLKATFMIADMNNKTGGENTKKTYCLGQDLFTVYANNSYTCEVTMMGCAWVQPLMYFVLNNVPLFRGSYLIQKVTHNIVPGNMTTKFTGVRMANTLSPFVKNVYYASIDNSKDISQTVVTPIEEEDKNCCQHNGFSVGENSGGIKTNSTEDGDITSILTEEGGYAKYGCTDNVTNRYNTILDALCCVVRQEAGYTDKLQCQLTTTVLYNLWKKNGEDFKGLFKDNVTAYKHENNGGDKMDFIKDIVTEIFTQTPMVVVGQTTRVNTGVTIYSNNKLTYEYTKPVTITQEMVQKMFMYCSSQGYDVSNTWSIQKYNSKGEPYLEAHPEYWRSKQYLCHHQYKNSFNGHVYVGDEIIWEYTPPQPEDGVGQDGVSNLGLDFRIAVQQSIDAEKINCSIFAEYPSEDDPNSFYITSNNESELGVVFDIILNTYSEYVLTLNWLCDNENDISSNNYPSKIFVTVTDGNAVTHSINVGYMKDKSFVLISQTSDNVNDAYYAALKKAYDVTTQDGLNAVKSDCKQFSGLDDDKIIELITKQVKYCPEPQTTPTVVPNQVPTPKENNTPKKETKPSTKKKPKQAPKKNEEQTSSQTKKTSNSCGSKGVVDKSNLVKNEKMKIVLSDVGHLNSNKLGKCYQLPNNSYHGCCTAGPSTWYQRSGMNIDSNKWWCGKLKKGSECTFKNTKSYLKGLGFVPIWHGTINELNKLQGTSFTNVGSSKLILYPGDVATVYTGHDGHAHGMMWDGTNWRSDCVQKQANCYTRPQYADAVNKDYGGIIWRHPDYQDSDHAMLPEIS